MAPVGRIWRSRAPRRPDTAGRPPRPVAYYALSASSRRERRLLSSTPSVFGKVAVMMLKTDRVMSFYNIMDIKHINCMDSKEPFIWSN